ncbi:MAG: transcriptional regulator, family [Paenibacillus sp.]|nr:transcriptional regulator, family [Paenibacillus sp.]
MNLYEQVFRMHGQAMAVIAEQEGNVRVLDANDAFIRLTGFDKDELVANRESRFVFSYPADLSRRALKSEMTLVARTGQELHVRYEQVPLTDSSDSGISDGITNKALVLFEDLTAYNWISQQLLSRSILVSGIVDEHMHIRFLRDRLAPLMFEPERMLEDESLLAFVADSDHDQIRTILEQASSMSGEQSITLHTSKQSGVELELELTYVPIMDGCGKLKEFAFVIWDLRPSDEMADPSVKLKIWMAKRDMSAGALSAATGISLQTISKLRNGKISKPQRLTAELIAAELAVEVHEIWPIVRR